MIIACFIKKIKFSQGNYGRVYAFFGFPPSQGDAAIGEFSVVLAERNTFFLSSQVFLFYDNRLP